MKIVIGIVLLVLMACRTTEKLFEKEKRLVQEDAVAEVNWWQEQRQYGNYLLDTTATYWYLQTDAPFFYHPDSGIYATKGILSLLTRNARVDAQIWKGSSEALSRQDSLTKNTWSEREVTKERKPGVSWVGRFIFVLCGVAVVYVVWRNFIKL